MRYFYSQGNSYFKNDKFHSWISIPPKTETKIKARPNRYGHRPPIQNKIQVDWIGSQETVLS